MLDRFRIAKQPELDRLRKLAEAGGLPAPLAAGTPRPDFLRALLDRSGYRGAPVAVIAEYKRASPSRGVIETGVSPEDAALAYTDAGATAISVLTEETYFGGDLTYLERMVAVAPTIPLLRKDFIMDPLQVAATAATPAAALLLIVRLTPDARTLRDLREQAEAHGVHAVVEIFDEADLALARESGARIIQVNNRDLETLAVDRTACLRLGPLSQPDEVWIAASGIAEYRHLAEAADAGYDAALVGTALMDGGDLEGSLLRLLGREGTPSFRPPASSGCAACSGHVRSEYAPCASGSPSLPENENPVVPDCGGSEGAQ
ncbi:indole-3-glycerol-phosphate synthase [Desulfovibrio oxamicus]|uniref:indole-3-glycerol-phosphate synthase n=1 Tax=Nitratidesulfovibrio oxamicus TaxID=32016 RepID=A0ABS0J8X1_9BACT|nr:indole-3-glycerol-phosphate synthase [Nitratidesulfovibrio oxamicus]MBG3878841.1 indole-3-glycerol-phosphate synthase [Nitratidesulfovibrio oxamicus]